MFRDNIKANNDESNYVLIGSYALCVIVD